jgi:hypothetical protein
MRMRFSVHTAGARQCPLLSESGQARARLDCPLTAQTKELAALAQKVTLATVEPLKTGATKAFGQPT